MRAAVRLGGDEFVLALEPRGEAEALRSCEDLRVRMLRRLAHYDADLSIGLAPILDGAGAALALVHADEALYLRKRAGGGGVSCPT